VGDGKEQVDELWMELERACRIGVLASNLAQFGATLDWMVVMELLAHLQPKAWQVV
jgi:hypothetical protein